MVAFDPGPQVEDYIKRVLPKTRIHEVVIARKISEVLAPFRKRANMLTSVEAIEVRAQWTWGG